MEISLIRHGKSKHIENHKMTCDEFKNWIQKYDNRGVFEEEVYPLDTLKKISMANIIVTSDLKRSIDSARLLNPNLQRISSALYRETELPVISKKIGGLKLKPSLWAVIFRCLWLAGFGDGCESLNEAKKRANKAAVELIGYAKKHKSIVFVGHGFINQLIAKELQNMGWDGKRKTNSKHWSCTTYTFHS